MQWLKELPDKSPKKKKHYFKKIGPAVTRQGQAMTSP